MTRRNSTRFWSRFWSTTISTLALAIGFAHPAIARPPEDAQPTRSREGDVTAIAEEAYVYGYPLVLMNATEQSMTNVTAPTVANGVVAAPINQFVRMTTPPSADSKQVVRPNVDTLYALAWLELAKGPMVVHVPDTHGRYYVMEMLDAWTNVFAAPGKRTTGTGAHDFAIVGPGWKGALPKGVEKIQAPTNKVWIVARTQWNGPSDLVACNEVQAQYSIVPMELFRRRNSSPRTDDVTPSPDQDGSHVPPPQVVSQLDAVTYFKTLSRLMIENPAAKADAPALRRFEAIGFVPGRDFNPRPEVAAALADLPQRAMQKIANAVSQLGKVVNGWQIDTQLGSYGTRYEERAAVAAVGLGANLPEDAVYPMTMVDGQGQPLAGTSRYVIHFPKGKLPPVNAFWSITLYDDQGYFVPNSINRYALGSRSEMRTNADGSLDVYVQKDPATGDLASNWLPAPDGNFNLTMRLYWPKESVLKGGWAPPPVEKAAVKRVGRAAPPAERHP